MRDALHVSHVTRYVGNRLVITRPLLLTVTGKLAICLWGTRAVIFNENAEQVQGNAIIDILVSFGHEPSILPTSL